MTASSPSQPVLPGRGAAARGAPPRLRAARAAKHGHPARRWLPRSTGQTAAPPPALSGIKTHIAAVLLWLGKGL